jgi:hypothetical protein
MYMTQLVSIYQLLWGFILGVLQMMPGVGSETGYSLSEINSSFWSGFECFLEIDQVKDHHLHLSSDSSCV